MKKTLRKLCALVLSASLALGLCLPAAAADAAPRATARQDGAFLRGSFTFGPHENAHDLTDTFIYSDDYFQGSSYQANPHLATMSMQVAAASISSEDTKDYHEKSQNIQALLAALGFQDIQVNDDYKEQMEQNTMGAAVAYKPLDDNTVLLAIVPRSAGYEHEWGGNFNVSTGKGDANDCYSTEPIGFQGTDGLHAGFQLARNIVLAEARSYVAEHADALNGKTVKVWTMGYSRGAATANLVGAAIVDDSEHAIGLSDIQPENVYAYTFGTPATVQPADDNAPHAEQYGGIHNYLADYDPVPMAPFAGWGFTRYGSDTVYNDSARKPAMLNFLRQLNRNVYDISTQPGGDVDNFTGYTVSFGDSGLSLVPSGQNISQKEFLQARIRYLTDTIAPDRKTYADDYQTVLSNLIAFYLGEDDNTVNAFLQGIQSDRNNLLSLGLLLAFYDWADQNDTQQTQIDAAKAAALLKEVLPQPHDEQEGDYLASAEYQQIYAIATNADNLAAYLTMNGYHSNDYLTQANGYMKNVLTAGLTKAGIALDSEFGSAILSDSSVAGLTRFVGYLVFGSDVKLANINDADTLKAALLSKVNNAATLIGNSGTYMRVHNNEIILSWLRTMDSYYDTESSSSDRDDDNTEPTYSLRIQSAEHGSVALSAKNAAQGSSVTLTVTPDSGYVLADLSVTDYRGNALSLTRQGEQRFLLTMPAGNLLINAVFRPASSAPAGYDRFADLASDAWYTSGVRYGLEQGLMTGLSDTQFGPDGTASRAMVATVLWRLSGSPAADGKTTFSDVADSAWYAQAVRWAAAQGVAAGYDDGSFGVNDPITREQFAVMLYRMAQQKGQGFTGSWYFPLNYADADTVSAWADEAMHWCVMHGILSGTGANALSPKGELTRAQLATMLMQVSTLEQSA